MKIENLASQFYPFPFFLIHNKAKFEPLLLASGLSRSMYCLFFIHINNLLGFYSKMTRWKNEHKKVPKTNLIPMAWDMKHSGSAGFSGGGLVMQNGGSGDCVSSSTEVPSSTTLSSIKENGLLGHGHGHTNGTLQYEGNGDDTYSNNENEPCSSTAPSSTYTAENHRQDLRVAHSQGRSNEAAGSAAPSSLGAAPQHPTAADFLKDHSQIQNRGAIPLGPPPTTSMYIVP